MWFRLTKVILDWDWKEHLIRKLTFCNSLAAAESMIKMLVSASMRVFGCWENLFFKKKSTSRDPASNFVGFFFLIEKTNYWAMIKIRREYWLAESLSTESVLSLPRRPIINEGMPHHLMKMVRPNDLKFNSVFWEKLLGASEIVFHPFTIPFFSSIGFIIKISYSFTFSWNKTNTVIGILNNFSQFCPHYIKKTKTPEVFIVKLALLTYSLTWMTPSIF